MWEPRPLTTLWASTVCYRDSSIQFAEKCSVEFLSVLGIEWRFVGPCLLQKQAPERIQVVTASLLLRHTDTSIYRVFVCFGLCLSPTVCSSCVDTCFCRCWLPARYPRSRLPVRTTPGSQLLERYRLSSELLSSRLPATWRHLASPWWHCSNSGPRLKVSTLPHYTIWFSEAPVHICLWVYKVSIHFTLLNSMTLSPQVNYTDRASLSAKLVPTSADRGYRVLSATNSHGR
jgi:hypothetical protein